MTGQNDTFSLATVKGARLSHIVVVALCFVNVPGVFS